MTYFRQMASADGDTLSYLLADLDRRLAVLIDPAADQATLYLALLAEIQARLTHVLLTHSHDAAPDGLTRLLARSGATLCANQRTCQGLETTLACQPLTQGDVVACGDEVIRIILTPGHTAGCASYLWRDRAFTGGALLIDDCGSTDGSDSDPGALYDSLTRQLLTLPDETLIYPGRSSAGRLVSSIGEQRRRNPSLVGLTRDEFIAAQRLRTLSPPQPFQQLQRIHHAFVEKQP